MQSCFSYDNWPVVCILVHTVLSKQGALRVWTPQTFTSPLNSIAIKQKFTFPIKKNKVLTYHHDHTNHRCGVTQVVRTVYLHPLVRLSRFEDERGARSHLGRFTDELKVFFLHEVSRQIVQEGQGEQRRNATDPAERDPVREKHVSFVVAIGKRRVDRQREAVIELHRQCGAVSARRLKKLIEFRRQNGATRGLIDFLQLEFRHDGGPPAWWYLARVLSYRFGWPPWSFARSDVAGHARVWRRPWVEAHDSCRSTWRDKKNYFWLDNRRLMKFPQGEAETELNCFVSKNQKTPV